MSPEQIDLVKTSWEKVKPISETAATLFYGKLFELDPKLKSLFKSDMTEQGKKLMQMIGVAVANLNDLGAVLEPVKELGRRHVGYKVEDSDYDTVGTALLWTFDQGLGEDFTEDVEAAWTETYQILANTMKQAAAEVA